MSLLSDLAVSWQHQCYLRLSFIRQTMLCKFKPQDKLMSSNNVVKIDSRKWSQKQPHHKSFQLIFLVPGIQFPTRRTPAFALDVISSWLVRKRRIINQPLLIESPISDWIWIFHWARLFSFPFFGGRQTFRGQPHSEQGTWWCICDSAIVRTWISDRPLIFSSTAILPLQCLYILQCSRNCHIRPQLVENTGSRPLSLS